MKVFLLPKRTPKVSVSFSSARPPTVFIMGSERWDRTHGGREREGKMGVALSHRQLSVFPYLRENDIRSILITPKYFAKSSVLRLKVLKISFLTPTYLRNRRQIRPFISRRARLKKENWQEDRPSRTEAKEKKEDGRIVTHVVGERGGERGEGGRKGKEKRKKGELLRWADGWRLSGILGTRPRQTDGPRQSTAITPSPTILNTRRGFPFF